jgi:hypothetical protein
MPTICLPFMTRIVHIFSLCSFLIASCLGQSSRLNPSSAISTNSVCYTCFFRDAGMRPELGLVPFYKSQINVKDPIVAADARFIVWRATGVKDCTALDLYRGVKGDPDRRLTASANAGFSAWECSQDGSPTLEIASKLATGLGRHWEGKTLHRLASGRLAPRFRAAEIQTDLKIPTTATSMVLGESTIELTSGLRVGTQVERVYRDWLSYELPWDMTKNASALPLVWDDAHNRPYHEGAVIANIRKLAKVRVTPLSGTLIARNAGGKWYGPDDKGIFRFEILDDKVEYPTTHSHGDFAWVVDTHGISALVSQALESRSQLVVGCGDSEGKAQAAYYLAQKGVNVLMPADRYQYLLIGYRAKGTIIGSAPIKTVNGRPVIGHQPVRISLSELIVAEDTNQIYPLQYYDAPSRYFRQLSNRVSLRVKYVKIDHEDQIVRVLRAADSVVAVRVKTENEDIELRRWLRESPTHRAILFHSGLYPFAQPLFSDFPNQVTFGDLRPRFE